MARRILGNLQVLRPDIFHQLVLRGAPKRAFVEQKRVQSHPKRPHIGRSRAVLIYVGVACLRRHEMVRPLRLRNQVRLVKAVQNQTNAEVDQLRMIILSENYVLRLDVAMDHTLLVAEEQALGDLADYSLDR